MQHIKAQHNTTQHNTMQCNTAQHSTAQHSTAQHSTAQHSTAQHSTAQHSTAQHSTAQHSTAQHSTAQHCYFSDIILLWKIFKVYSVLFLYDKNKENICRSICTIFFKCTFLACSSILSLLILCNSARSSAVSSSSSLKGNEILTIYKINWKNRENCDFISNTVNFHSSPTESIEIEN